MATMNDIHEILDYPEWQQRAYENLANEIVKGMAEDYIDYLISNFGHINQLEGKLIPKFEDKRAQHLEKTLRGPWYQTLTKIDSEYMIQKCRSEAYDRREKFLKKQEEERKKKEAKEKNGKLDIPAVS